MLELRDQASPPTPLAVTATKPHQEASWGTPPQDWAPPGVYVWAHPASRDDHTAWRTVTEAAAAGLGFAAHGLSVPLALPGSPPRPRPAWVGRTLLGPYLGYQAVAAWLDALPAGDTAPLDAPSLVTARWAAVGVERTEGLARFWMTALVEREPIGEGACASPVDDAPLAAVAWPAVQAVTESPYGLLLTLEVDGDSLTRHLGASTNNATVCALVLAPPGTAVRSGVAGFAVEGGRMPPSTAEVLHHVSSDLDTVEACYSLAISSPRAHLVLRVSLARVLVPADAAVANPHARVLVPPAVLSLLTPAHPFPHPSRTLPAALAADVGVLPLVADRTLADVVLWTTIGVCAVCAAALVKAANRLALVVGERA